MLVTASVDAIQLRKRLAIETDMTIQGQVVWTGSSSMDIRMELLQVCISLFCHTLVTTCNACFLPSGSLRGLKSLHLIRQGVLGPSTLKAMSTVMRGSRGK